MLECIRIDAESDNCILKADGNCLDASSLRASLTREGEICIDASDMNIYQAIAAIPIRELVSKVFEVGLSVELSILDSEEFVGFEITFVSFTPADGGKFELSIMAEFNPGKWCHPWTMLEHSHAFEQYLISNDFEFSTYSMEQSGFLGNVPGVNNFEVGLLEHYSKYETLKEAVEDHISIFRSGLIHVVDKLKKKESQASIYRKFVFPEQVSIPCQQYLMYFTQFLSDLGVDATASIANEAGEILFSVTPEDQSEALEKIKLALEVFLRLPAAPSAISLASSACQNIELQQLTANIQHLQSQLMLANATMQQQSLTIQQQSSTLQNALRGTGQPRPFSGEIIIESMTVDADKKDPGEPILGGLVSVKKGKFLSESVEIDLPKLIRMLKKFLNDL